jgi:arylformamidase
VVVDARTGSGRLDRPVIDALELPLGAPRVLLKTPNSALWDHDEFIPKFVRLSADGADALVERGVQTVGIDYLSVGDPGAHVQLLSRGVGVIEGLDLRGVDPGEYFLTCLPLKIAGSDGAPARALLWPRHLPVLNDRR